MVVNGFDGAREATLLKSWPSLTRKQTKASYCQILSGGFNMGEVEGHWIRFMVQGHHGVPPLAKIRLCNAVLTTEIWRILIRDMEKAMLEELDLEGSNITAEMAVELLSGFNSQSRLKRLNLRRTEIGPQFEATTATDLSTFNFEIEVDPLPPLTPPPQPQPEYSPPKMQSSFPWNPYGQIPGHDPDHDPPLVPPGAPKMGHLQLSPDIFGPSEYRAAMNAIVSRGARFPR